jgi:cell division transport system permease protein
MRAIIHKWVFSNKTDLPFAQSPGSRILPWVMGTMTYLIYVVVATAVIGHTLIDNWSAYFASRLTIEVPPIIDDNMSESAYQQKVQQITNSVTRLHPAARVHMVEKEKIQSLLEPWLGKGNITADLPMPILIDVDLPPRETNLQLDKLSTQLNELLPGVVVEDHQQWRELLVNLVKSVEYFGFWLGLLLVLSMLLMLVFTTHSELVIHDRVIKILQIIGAPTRYIARQFQKHALKVGLEALCISLVLGVITCVILSYVLSALDLTLTQQWHIGHNVLMVLPIIGLMTVLLEVITARISATLLLDQTQA